MTPHIIPALAAVTADTTSGAIDIFGAKKVALQLTASAITSGNGIFTLTGSIDGTNYVTINGLIDNLASTNAQTVVRVASVTLSSNTSKIYALDLASFAYRYIKVAVDMTTDGAYSATVIAEYED